jgi:hypothetical protein
MLQDFLNQLTRAQVATKDHEAQILIARAFAQQPDAAYLVVQRALLLEQALKQAQAQLAQLQQQSSRFCRHSRLEPGAQARSWRGARDRRCAPASGRTA